MLKRTSFFPRVKKDGQDSQIIEIRCLRRSYPLTLVYWAFSLLTCGIFALVLYWLPKYDATFTFTVVALEDATHVAVFNDDESVQVARLRQS